MVRRWIGPAQWMFGRQPNERGGSFQRPIPFLLRFGENLPANLQHGRVGVVLGGGILQLLVGFEMVSQLDPTMSGFEMDGVRRFE